MRPTRTATLPRGDTGQVAPAREAAAGTVALFAEDELAPGEMRAVQVGSRAVVVMRKRDGSFRALRDRCPHEGACLSDGRLRPMIVSSEPGVYEISEERDVVHCPWHAFEFDVDDGRSPGNPAKMRVASYPVSVVDGVVVITMRKKAKQ